MTPDNQNQETVVNPDLDLEVTITATQGQIVELCRCLDMAVRARGNEAVGTVAFWLEKLQGAVNAAAQDVLERKAEQGTQDGEEKDQAERYN